MERFWDKVDATGECWVWTGARNHRGYGDFTIERGDHRLAHRFAWEFENGPIPDGLFVLHSCDNPPCVRIEHLFLGSNHDNVTDMVAKGRNRKGSSKPNASLNEELVTEIRQRYSDGGVTQRGLAAEYGVSYGVIQTVVTRRSWKHVP